MRERRHVTIHLALEKWAPVFHQVEANPNLLSPGCPTLPAFYAGGACPERPTRGGSRMGGDFDSLFPCDRTSRVPHPSRVLCGRSLP